MRLSALLLAIFLVPAASLASGATRVIHFGPFGSHGGMRLDYRASSTLHGYCWTESIASARSDAWRCMVGNRIFDPCFTNPSHSRVACADDAFSRSVTLVVLDRPLPRRGPNQSPPLPWALRLANGTRCQVATGATGIVGGMRLNYACSSRGWVLGDIDRSQEPWRVYYSAKADGSHSRKISVKEAVI